MTRAEAHLVLCNIIRGNPTSVDTTGQIVGDRIWVPAECAYLSVKQVANDFLDGYHEAEGLDLPPRFWENTTAYDLKEAFDIWFEQEACGGE